MENAFPLPRGSVTLSAILNCVINVVLGHQSDTSAGAVSVTHFLYMVVKLKRGKKNHNSLYLFVRLKQESKTALALLWLASKV